jgi:hypothetical protein
MKGVLALHTRWTRGSFKIQLAPGCPPKLYQTNPSSRLAQVDLKIVSALTRRPYLVQICWTHPQIMGVLVTPEVVKSRGGLATCC